LDIIEFKPSQLSVTLVKIYDNNLNDLKKTLAQKLAKAGKFLRGSPVVLLPDCPLTATDLARIIELLRQYEMSPIGIHTTEMSLMEYAELSGLAIIKKPIAETSNADKTAAHKSPEENTATETAATAQNKDATEASLHTAKVVTSSLRSGQLIQHLFNDVIVRGSVNSGAEIFAGGNLNIYGSVRGRVHAGATGNQQSRIIAHNFNPELVSIAGVFLLSEDIPTLAKKGWVEVSLDNQRLKFTPLTP